MPFVRAIAFCLDMRRLTETQPTLEPIPEDLRQFLQSYITSVEQLEILRILGEDPAREWTAEDIGKLAQVSVESIRIKLQELQQRGLLRCRVEETALFCQFGPHTQDLDDALRRLLTLYRQRPVSMIRLVYERPASSLRDFADAFRIRSKD
jgi:hypothetical protein